MTEQQLNAFIERLENTLYKDARFVDGEDDTVGTSAWFEWAEAEMDAANLSFEQYCYVEEMLGF